jgi:phospholipid/cholesterol/gamma-HCH transport system ATP-binding protein
MIRVEGLKLSLGPRAVLRDVSLTVAAGETVALMGASGSGKSTVVRAIVGLVKPDRGQVWLDGEAVTGAGAARLRELRRKVGMLFQQNALFDSMTVAENIGFVLREVMGLSDAEISARVKELLERLHLGPIEKMYPSELSGGMKKRVGIARAVAHDPAIVFYDDPTAGLDPITSEVIGSLIAELGRKKDRAVMIVSNYLPLIMNAARRVLLLHQGRIIEVGTPADVLKSESPEIRDFLDSKVEE